MNWIVFLGTMAVEVFMALWIRKATKCEGKTARMSTLLVCWASFTMLTQGLFVISNHELLAYIAISCYYAAVSWLVVALLLFVESYTGVIKTKPWVKCIICLFVLVDTVSLLLNPVLKHAITLTRITKERSFAFWHISYNTGWFWYHVATAVTIAVFSLMALLVRALKTPYFYRARYFRMFNSVTIALILNMVSIAQNLPFDYSALMYIVVVIQISYYVLFYKPVKLVNETLAMVVRDVEDIVFCFDLWDHCAYINEARKKYFPDESWERPLREIVASRIKSNRDKDVEVEEWEQEVGNGEERYVFNIQYRKMRDGRGNYLGCFFIMHDRTEEIRAFEAQHYQITRDKLTGLYNREYFLKKAEERLRKNPDKKYYMICSNVKGFKLYNDLFGEEQGDAVLKAHGELLRKCGTLNTVYGRLTGDEFAIMVPKDTYTEEIYVQCVKHIKSRFDNSQYQMHINLGVYEITDIEEPISVMCDKAKMAIEAKSGDYNEIVVYFDDSLMLRTLHERQVAGEFDRALKNKEFCMYLQPQIGEGDKVIGAEALVRWQHPERGLVFPGDFIGVFEKTGLIYKLDEYMWELAAQKLKEWKDAGEENLHISVNISARDFYYMDIYEKMTSLVEKYSISPAKLKLEITETAMMTEMKNQITLLERLRDYGFQIEIDDFGSGYSSLNMLKDITVDIVKIDMGFLRESERSEKGASILNYTISLINRLGMGVITEGVETKEQVESLTKMGCNMFQGYYFAKPMPVDAFEEKYRQEQKA